MNLRQLEVFHAVMKTGTITGAAQMLHVTQPAVSATLQLAERRLGVVLFERVKGRLLPTAEAQRLWDDAAEIYARLQTFSRVADEMRLGRASELVLSTSPTLINTLLPRAVTELRARHPKMSVLLHAASTRLAVERVARRESDVGVVYGPIDGQAVESTELGRSRLACVMPAGHPLARKTVVTPADLQAYPLISLAPGSPLSAFLGAAGALDGAGKPVISMDGSSWFTACQFVASGAGVAVVDLLAAASGEVLGLTYRRLSVESEITVLMIRPLGREVSKPSRALETILRRLLKGYERMA